MSHTHVSFNQLTEEKDDYTLNTIKVGLIRVWDGANLTTSQIINRNIILLYEEIFM